MILIFALISFIEMQHIHYKIEVNIKSVKGYVPFCSFILGNIHKNAETIFSNMEGKPVNIGDCAPFQLNLAYYEKNSTTILATQYCSLPELKENCHYISKEVFKILNLE